MPFVRMPADFVSEISRFGFPQNQVRLSRRLESPPKGKWGIRNRCERSRQCGLAELLARPMLGSVRAPDAPQYYIPRRAASERPEVLAVRAGATRSRFLNQQEPVDCLAYVAGEPVLIPTDSGRYCWLDHPHIGEVPRMACNVPIPTDLSTIRSKSSPQRGGASGGVTLQ